MATGRDNGFDVVLIDTAGRMQDNEVPLSLGLNWRSSGLTPQLASDADRKSVV